MVVFVLPLAELQGELAGGPEDHPSVELVFIGSMAALDLAVDLGAVPRNLAVDHPEIPQVQVKSVPNSEPWSVWIRWLVGAET